MAKNVLLIGQGGREHALAWKLHQSPKLAKLYAAPGNPGIAEFAECVDIAVTDIEGLLAFARKNQIDLTVVGPEIPLMLGVADRFAAEGLAVFGPTAGAAQLEGSKVFSKGLFEKYQIPTAGHGAFEESKAAKAYVRKCTPDHTPVVVKADGLAAGKGVIIAQGWEEADAAIDYIMEEKAFGEAGNRLVIEEFLEGEELSFFAISDGSHFIPLLSAQDYKRIFDNDEGPNTGGMGAYTSPPVYTPQLHDQIMEQIIAPVVAAMKEEGLPYLGVLYAGLMITPKGPKVLEFNARFGDPETQVLMPVIETDLIDILEGAVEGTLDQLQIEISKQACVCVVISSPGYPGTYHTGYEIQGLDQLSPDILVFHAGTRTIGDKLVTGGGRVLNLVARGEDIKAAREKVYAEIGKVNFTGMHYRKDIARRALT